MITLSVATAEGKRLGTVTEKAIGQLDGPSALVEMLTKMLSSRGLQSIVSLDGWSNGYLVIRAAGKPLPGPAEDNRPRKIGGTFSTKGPPSNA